MSNFTGRENEPTRQEKLMEELTEARSLDLRAIDPGIYFIFLKGYLVYIGKSESVSRRISNHRDSFTFDEVYYVNCPIEKLTKYEAYYIAKYKPLRNLERYEQLENGEFIKKRHKRVVRNFKN